MDHEVDPPRRLAFAEDDWKLIEWTDALLRRAAQRGDLSDKSREILTAFQQEVLKLPIASDGYFEFDVSNGESGRHGTLGFELDSEVFCVWRVETYDDGGCLGIESQYSDILRIDHVHREGPDCSCLEECFAVMARWADTPGYPVSVSGEGGRHQQALDVTVARHAWKRLFTGDVRP